MTRLAFISVVIFLSGCASAGTSTFNVVPPIASPVTNEIVIDSPFEECWSHLVEGLAKSFFVINNIEKDSGIINVSFHTETPEDYVDCGQTTRTFKKGPVDDTFTYEVAEDSFYRSSEKTGINQVTLYNVQRTTSLEGRINIFVAPMEDRTKVGVNARYIFTMEAGGTYEVVGGALEVPQGSGQIPPSSTEYSFNTNESEKKLIGTYSDGRPAYLECYSSGRLEESILRMADPTK